MLIHFESKYSNSYCLGNQEFGLLTWSIEVLQTVSPSNVKFRQYTSNNWCIIVDLQYLNEIHNCSNGCCHAFSLIISEDVQIPEDASTVSQHCECDIIDFSFKTTVEC